MSKRRLAIIAAALAIAALALMLAQPLPRTGPQRPAPTAQPPLAQTPRLVLEPVDRVAITVVVDNNPGPSGLRTAWGISLYIEAGRYRILFDTGPDPEVLAYNAKALGINLSQVDIVVISHCHGDHTGGLPLIAKLKPGAKVYIPPDPGLAGYVKSLGLTPVHVGEPRALAAGVGLTGPLYGPPVEQSLLIYVKNLGLIVVTGCAHPGVENIVSYAHNITGLPVYAVIGGFHLAGCGEPRLAKIAGVFKSLGVAHVYPIHCSGDNARAYFREKLGSAYGDGHVGLTLVFTGAGVRVARG